MTFGSLCAGIGGVDLGLDRAGLECRWQVDIDPYCREVLAKHWPHVERHGDIYEAQNLTPVDLIAAGFPCQPVSLMGVRQKQSDERWLWPEVLRIIRQLRPRYVLIENVAGLLTGGFDIVLCGLSESGYDAEWDSVPIGYFGAPHERERVFILAYSDEVYGTAGMGHEQDRPRPIFAGSDCPRLPVWLQTADQFIGMDDGVPFGVYKACVGAIGNAVSPQIAEWIGSKIIDKERSLLKL